MDLSRIKIYHLDDDLFELKRVREKLESEKDICQFVVSSFETKTSFLEAVKAHGPSDIALLDVHLGTAGKNEGIEFAKSLRKQSPSTIQVVYSNDFSVLRQCLQQGVDDFIQKSADMQGLGLRLFSIAKSHQKLIDSQPSEVEPSRFVGATIQAAMNRLAKIQSSAIRTIHVLGESGTGKEVIAECLRKILPGKTPFVKVNCAAISPQLLESELFGHARGAFTGATGEKAGYMESASGGWIFLDEIACLSPSAQAAMLRVIENQEVIRVGETKPRPINVKIISATNIPLEQLVRDKQFRNDLFQRLREAEIVLPPLRQRKDELGAVIDHFCSTETGGPYSLTNEARTILESLDWADGNIRAVRNCIRAMTEHHTDKILSANALPEWVWKEYEGHTPSILSSKDQDRSGHAIVLNYPGPALPSFDNLTDLLLVEVVRQLRSLPGFHSIRKISPALGIARTTLAYKLKKIADRGLMSMDEIDQLNEDKKGAS
jgi:DNA-binding NtrC family response regulator